MGICGSGGLEQKTIPGAMRLTPKESIFVMSGRESSRLPTRVTMDSRRWVRQTHSHRIGYGLYGITGNAWEWMRDWFHPAYHVTTTRVNPLVRPRKRKGDEGRILSLPQVLLQSLSCCGKNVEHT